MRAVGVVTTVKANCRDCYKCVRQCPMKAIRVVGGHAEIAEERCVSDGNCIRVCPQGAKRVPTSLSAARECVDRARDLHTPVVASLAPSFAAADLASPGKMITALRKLGFSAVEETALGAELVARAHVDALRTNPEAVITSSCPAVVNLIEKYYPRYIKHLSPVVSPMIAHAKAIKARYGAEARVVFVGPCAAKKEEAVRPEFRGLVDAVLTFEEVLVWIRDEGISFDECEESAADGIHPALARLFPLGGGLAPAAGLPKDALAPEIITATGLDRCRALLDNLPDLLGAANPSVKAIELLACPGGCIGGPFAPSEADLEIRRARVIKWQASAREKAFPDTAGGEDECESREPFEEEIGRLKAGLDLSREYTPNPVHLKLPTEQELSEILAMSGKFRPEDELNCGACGYDSCRDKAVAVFQGMAEVEMCIPNMRARAESMSSVILTATPNGVVVVDRHLKIIDVNPAFQRMFSASRDRAIGAMVSEFLDPAAFASVFDTQTIAVREGSYLDGALITREHIFYVDHQDVVVALISDITSEVQQKRKLEEAKAHTLEKAQEVIDKQMRVAQEIAGLLGETTAETKVLLTQLMRLMQEKG